METNLEKEQLYKVISYIKKSISEYREFYQKLNEVYIGDLKKGKRLAEKIKSDIEANYSSEKTEVYILSGQLNGRIYGIQSMLDYVLTNMTYWIEEQQIKLNKLEDQYRKM